MKYVRDVVCVKVTVRRHTTYFTCASPGPVDIADVKELRRLVKRIDKRATVVVEDPMYDLHDVIEEMTYDELREHHEVLDAIAECAA